MNWRCGLMGGVGGWERGGDRWPLLLRWALLSIRVGLQMVAAVLGGMRCCSVASLESQRVTGLSRRIAALRPRQRNQKGSMLNWFACVMLSTAKDWKSNWAVTLLTRSRTVDARMLRTLNEIGRGTALRMESRHR